METIAFTPSDIARFLSKIDETDTCWLWLAFKDREGYGRFQVSRQSRAAHRVAYEMAIGPIPEGMILDHICRVPSCVRPVHLRVATNKQNQENLSGAYANSKSGVRGVRWNKQRRKWSATVNHDGKSYHGGFFVSIQDAEQAAIALRNRLFTHNELDRIA